MVRMSLQASEHSHLVPSRERLLSWVKSPFWRGRPFVMVNLLRFRRDASSVSTKAARASYKKYTAMLTASNGGKGDVTDGRIVMESYRCHALFTPTIDADAVVMVEWSSPENFLKAVSTPHYMQAHVHRAAALEATEMVAVQHPGAAFPLKHDSNLNTFDMRLWMSTVSGAGSLPQTSQQIIAPDGERLGDMFTDTDSGWQKGTSEPMHMINFLQFVRPDGLQSYMEYGKNAAQAVKESAHTGGSKEGDGNGLLFPMMACATLLGDTQWDAFAVMGYANLSAFLGLTSNKQWKAAEHHRERGLHKQGLVVACPDTIQHIEGTSKSKRKHASWKRAPSKL